MKEARQLLRSGLTGVSTVAIALILAQKADRHLGAGAIHKTAPFRERIHVVCDLLLILVRISISHNPVVARGLSRNQEMKIGRAPVSTYAAEFGFAATGYRHGRRVDLACVDVSCSIRNDQSVSNRRLSRFSVPLLPKPLVRRGRGGVGVGVASWGQLCVGGAERA
jgi:hypothetical protein